MFFSQLVPKIVECLIVRTMNVVAEPTWDISTGTYSEPFMDAYSWSIVSTTSSRGMNCRSS